MAFTKYTSRKMELLALRYQADHQKEERFIQSSKRQILLMKLAPNCVYSQILKTEMFRLSDELG